MEKLESEIQFARRRATPGFRKGAAQDGVELLLAFGNRVQHAPGGVSGCGVQNLELRSLVA